MSDTYSAHKRQAGTTTEKPALRAAILSLHADGMGRNAIAREIGVTKSVVAGHLDRASIGPYVAPRESPPPAMAILGANACHFISGETLATYVFCGAPAVPGKPYCAPHCAVCYLPPKPEAKWTEKRARVCAVLGIVE